MIPAPISAFGNDIIRLRHGLWIGHQFALVIAQIACKTNGFNTFGCFHMQHRTAGTQNMSGLQKLYAEFFVEFVFVSVFHQQGHVQHVRYVLAGIQRLRLAATVVFSFFIVFTLQRLHLSGNFHALYIQTILQQVVTELQCRRCTQYFTAKTLTDQVGNIATVVDVGMRQYQQINALGIKRKTAVALLELTAFIIVQAAIHQHPGATGQFQ